MLKILFYIWQFPQLLLARIVIILTKAKKDRYYKGKKIYCFKRSFISGVSLGEYIILQEKYDKMILDHEYGHTIQSKIFGPFYLIIIGIPSMLFNNVWDRVFHKNWEIQDSVRWYYSRYPEKWADKLGGVERFT